MTNEPAFKSATFKTRTVPEVDPAAKKRNLAIAGGVFVVIVFLGWNLVVAPTASSPRAPAPAVSSEPAVLPNTPGLASSAPTLPAGGSVGSNGTGSLPAGSSVASNGSASLPAASSESQRRSYAIGLHELRGLPADAAPGTRLEMWVAWEPPITREPRIQRLLREVILEKVAMPVAPEAPQVAVVSVRADQVGDLLYGDRWGELSVMLLP